MNSSCVKISLADGDLAIRALNFIDAIAFRLYRCAPPPPPQFIFAAESGSNIIGTMSVDFGYDYQPLPLEDIYQISANDFSLTEKRSDIAQFGRWMTVKPNLSFVLAYLATIFSLKALRTYGCFELKPVVADRIKSLEVALYRIESARLIFDRIPENGRSYYETPPTPSLYYCELLPTKEVLRPKALAVILSDSIVFDNNVSDLLR